MLDAMQLFNSELSSLHDSFLYLEYALIRIVIKKRITKFNSQKRMNIK